MMNKNMNNKSEASKNSFPDRLIRLPELMRITSLSRASAYRLIANDANFPKPIKLSNSTARNSAVGFSFNELQQWIQKQSEKRG
jgi:prophage regulatory protein